MNAPLSPAEQHALEHKRYIGASVPRPNARRLVEGAAVYVDDIRLPRMLHVHFVRSAFAHARIRGIDTAAAAASRDVVAVYTGADLKEHVEPMVATLAHFKGMKAAAQPCLAIDRVCWQGEAVVAIVATQLRLAEDAAQFVEVVYDELPVVTNMETALDPGAHVIHPELGDNLCFTREIDSGNSGPAVAASALTVERTFRFPRHTGVCLEGRSVVGDFSSHSVMPTSINTMQVKNTATGVVQAIQLNIRLSFPFNGPGPGPRQTRPIAKPLAM